MLRRGVSCATAMDFLTVLYQTVVAGKDPLSELDKIPDVGAAAVRRR